MKEIVVIHKSSSVEQIRDKIMALSPLKIAGFRQIDPRESLICLQAEYGVLNNSKYRSGQEYKYIGTKRLADCIFFLIKNESNEYFFAHVDSQTNCRTILEKGIANFKKASECLEVTLIGGIPFFFPDESKSQGTTSPSNKILKSIIMQLINLAKDHQVHVVGQSLMEHNNNDPVLEKINLSSMSHVEVFDLIDKKKMKIYQDFCERVPLLFFYLYGQVFNSNFFDIKFPSPDALTEGHRYDDHTVEKMFGFANLLFFVKLHQFFQISMRVKEFFPELCKESNSKAVDNFYKLVSKMISLTGAILLENVGLGVPRQPKFKNFVIKLETGEIFNIPSHMKIYNEAFRNAHQYNPSSNQYFLFFHNQRYQSIPTLDAAVEEEYKNTKELIDNSKDHRAVMAETKFNFYNSVHLRERTRDFLDLYAFRKQWYNQTPTPEMFHDKVLYDYLMAHFEKLGLEDKPTILIEYIVEDPCPRAHSFR